MEEIEKDHFTTTDVSTASALLATGKVLFDGLKESGNGRKNICLTPRQTALELYSDYRRGELMVNASDNGRWVQKLKKEIFGGISSLRNGGQDGEIEI